MIEVALRIVAVLGAVGVAWGIVAVAERRRKHVFGLQPGITIVTSSTCAICPQAVSALRSAAETMSLRVLDASDPRSTALRASTAPTVVVADHNGREVLRRTGRATITDAARIVAAARSAASVAEPAG